jgi:hypothetical protein
MGYKLTGDTALLNRAKVFFNRGTKGEYGTGRRLAGDNVVHHFIDSTFDSSASNFYLEYNKGELQYTYLIFENGGLPTVDGTPAPAPPPPPPASFDFSISSGGNSTVVQGQSVSKTVTASLLSGTAQSVTFSASGLPAGTTATFNPASCSPACAPALTLSSSATTPAGSSTITITGTAGALTRTATFTLTVSASSPTADTTLPTVSMTAPASGATVSGATVSVTANASDNVGVHHMEYHQCFEWVSRAHGCCPGHGWKCQDLGRTNGDCQ